MLCEIAEDSACHIYIEFVLGHVTCQLHFACSSICLCGKWFWQICF